MASKKNNKFILRRRVILLSIVTLVAAAFIYSVNFILSIKPPDGNEVIGNPNEPASTNQNDPSNSDNDPSDNNYPKVYNFLIAGTDKVADNTDTIMMVRFDVEAKEVKILNIPRDTMLDTSRNAKKVNASYMVGGIEQFEKDVAGLVGFNVNRYIMIRLEGVEKLIDAIGGVDFDVPRNMNYEDPMQDLAIHLKKGYQHLDGGQALGLARYRYGYTNGDIGRIEVQQQLVKALAKQAMQPSNLLKLPSIVGLLMENVETDLTLPEMLWLANAAKDVKVEDIQTDMVPGVAAMVDGISYWLPYKEELLTLINESYKPTEKEITDLKIVMLPQNKGH